MKSKKVTIIDYGLGNLHSVENAVRRVGGDPIVSNNPELIDSAERLILPGVGAFGEGMANIFTRKLDVPLKIFARSGRPLLGICLGMQLLMSISEEQGIHKGLGLIDGKVVRFSDIGIDSKEYKVPHIGWGALQIAQSDVRHTIFRGLDTGEYVYFAHSYVVVPEQKDAIIATTVYGGHSYCSGIQRGATYGVQFHLEKSGETGLMILRNFLAIS